MIPKAVLLIEDEAPLRQVLGTALAAQGYLVVEAATGRLGLELAAKQKPDAIVLDLGLPDLDGLIVLKRLREWSRAAVLVVSARGDEASKVLALDGGADDYVTKPFGTGELLARLRAALRHAARKEGEDEPSIVVGDLRIDLAREHVFAYGRRVHLSPKEYALFAALMKAAGKVVTHRQLLTRVWGPEHEDRVEYLRVHMGALRKKLERDPGRPRYLQAEPGVGYRLRIDP